MPCDQSQSYQPEFTKAIFDADKIVPEQLRAPKQSSPTSRFNVYRNNVIVSLIEALKEGFPKVEQLVGEQFFREMSRLFVQLHPPKSPLMLYYGNEFSSFIDDFEPARSVPYLGDVARLEYDRRMAYFAKDSIPAPANWFVAYTEEDLANLQIMADPSLHIITSDFPLFDIWKTLEGDESTELSNTGQTVLSFRHRHGDIETQLAPYGAEQFFQNLSTCTLGEAIEATLQQDGTADISQLVSLALHFAIDDETLSQRENRS